jgi:hypothetical protein
MPPTPHKDFLAYLQELGPLIAATVAVGVASMQYYVQRQQMKQQLFDNRFEGYTVIKAYLVNVLIEAEEYEKEDTKKNQEKQYRRYAKAMSQAEFLFGPEVLRFVQDFRNLDLERKTHPHGEDEWCDATLELTRRVDDVDSIFRPYLQLHYEQSWLARFIARVKRWVDQDLPASMASHHNS